MSEHDQSDALAADVLAAAALRSPDGPRAGAGGLVPYLRAFNATVRFTALPTGLCGRTRWSTEGALIEVARDDSANRKVFTLAHELGHLLVEDASVNVDFALRLPRDGDGIERLCNNIAGRILMPDAWVQEVAAEVTSGGQVLEIADDIGVSSRALIIRFEQTGFPAVMVRAVKTAGGRWTARGAAGRLSHTWAAQLNLDALDECDTGTTRFSAPAPRPEWAVKDCVVGEVRKGTKTAIIWFTEPRFAPSEGWTTEMVPDAYPIVWSSRSSA